MGLAPNYEKTMKVFHGRGCMWPLDQRIQLAVHCKNKTKPKTGKAKGLKPTQNEQREKIC